MKTRFIQIAVVAARVGRQGRWQLPIGQSGDAVELGAGMTPCPSASPTPEQLGKSCDSVEGIGAGSWKSRWRVAAKHRAASRQTDDVIDLVYYYYFLFLFCLLCTCSWIYASNLL